MMILHTRTNPNNKMSTYYSTFNEDEANASSNFNQEQPRNLRIDEIYPPQPVYHSQPHNYVQLTQQPDQQNSEYPQGSVHSIPLDLPPSYSEQPEYQSGSSQDAVKRECAQKRLIQQPLLVKPFERNQLTNGPTTVLCPHCATVTTTRVSYKTGATTWLASIGIFVFGGFICGCCLAPFCFSSFKDAKHKCSHCRKTIGYKNRTI